MKILLVYKEEFLVEMYKDMIGSWIPAENLEFKCILSGDWAPDIPTGYDFVFITSILMPKYDGLTILNMMTEAGHEMPVLVTTALSKPGLKEETKEAYPNSEFMEKPFELTDFKKLFLKMTDIA